MATAESGLPGIVSNLSRSERIALVVVFFAWGGLLLAGLLVPTAPYREALSAPTEMSFLGLISYSLVVFLCYTITNVPLLCCLAAVLGAIGGRARIELDGEEGGQIDYVNPYASAVLRAFFVYLVVISGTMVSIENPVANFVEATQQQYVRLAVMLSAVGFVAGYNPGLFTKVLRGTEERILRTGAPEAGSVGASD